MIVQTSQYTRKPFPVEAVQVTEENRDEVAAWCKGEVSTTDAGDPFIKVKVVANPKAGSEGRAFTGDWVLKNTKGSFKVFNNKAFTLCFDEVPSPASVEAIQALKDKLSPSRV